MMTEDFNKPASGVSPFISTVSYGYITNKPNFVQFFTHPTPCQWRLNFNLAVIVIDTIRLLTSLLPPPPPKKKIYLTDTIFCHFWHFIKKPSLTSTITPKGLNVALTNLASITVHLSDPENYWFGIIHIFGLIFPFFHAPSPSPMPIGSKVGSVISIWHQSRAL